MVLLDSRPSDNVANNIGEKIIDAIMNLRVASKIGVKGSNTIDAATKLSPHTVATMIAEMVPLLISNVFNNSY